MAQNSGYGRSNDDETGVEREVGGLSLSRDESSEESGGLPS